jgi:hypothetical protein
LNPKVAQFALACIIHENKVFIHKHFKANGFEISTRLQQLQACSRLTLSTSDASRSRRSPSGDLFMKKWNLHE